ncbi:hypothetical protein [Shewanella baltica]|uniref:hypothetical protein n=1 Tax=Shewanella baltica TaxID=62322 RepID=UPI0039AFAEFE
MNIFDYEGDGSEDEVTLYSLSSEYLEAAKTLDSVPPTKVNYGIVTFYLLGHAAELSLKSYLFKKSLSVQDLRKVGHDLDSLLSKASELGLKSFSSIRDLSPIYKSKKLEFRQRSRETFPAVDSLIEEISELHSIVFDHICGF